MLTTTNHHQYEDDVDLLRYGRFLATHWIVLTGFAVVGASVALLIASRAPIRYQATATLAITQPTGPTAFALSPATARAILTNVTLVSATMAELRLHDEGMTPRSLVATALEIHSVPSTNLVRLSVALPDPTKAREAARILSEKAVVLSRRIDQEGATITRDALKQQMDEAAQHLNALEARLLAYKTAAQIELLAATTDSKLKEQGALARLTIDLEAEKARLAKMEEDLAQHPPVLSVPRDVNQRGVRSDARVFESANPFSNPVHSMLQYEIAQSRATISSLERQRRETLGTTGGADMVKQLNELYRRRIELARLEGEHEVGRRVYSDLVLRYEEARSRVIANTPQLQIVEAPMQPEGPLPRRRAQSAILGALVGVAVGLVAALLINRRKRVESLD